MPLSHTSEMSALVEDAKSIADRFVDEKLTCAAGHRTEKAALTKALQKWVEGEGEKYSTRIRNDLYRRLRSDGCTEKKGGRAKLAPCFEGVALHDD